MKRSIFLLVVIALAFAIGFGLRRSLSIAPKATTVSAPKSNPPQIPSPYIEAPQKDRAGAAAFYQWLKDTHLEDIVLWIKAADPSKEYTQIKTAMAEWARQSPEEVLKDKTDDYYAVRSAYIGLLLKSEEETLTTCPEEILYFCKQYVAARQTTFDPVWAKAFGISFDWYIEMWIGRGISPADALAAATKSDVNAVTRITRALTKRTDTSRSQITTFYHSLPKDKRTGCFDALLSHLHESQIPPLEQLKLLHELSSPTKGRRLYRSRYYHSALHYSPKEAVDFILNLEADDRQFAVRKSFGSIDWDAHPLGWLELYTQLPAEDRPIIDRAHYVIEQAMRVAPQLALQWFSTTLEKGQADEQSVLDYALSAGYDMAELSGTTTIADAQRIENPGLRDSFLSGAIDAIVEYDLESARSLLSQLSDEKRAEMQLHIQKREIHDAPFDVALTRLIAINDPALTDFVVADLRLPFKNRMAIVDAFPDSFVKGATTIATMAGYMAPQETADWLIRYKDQPGFETPVAKLMKGWAYININAAASWARQLPPGKAFDASALAIAESVSMRDPHSSIEWATSISNPDDRLKALQAAAVGIETYATKPNELDAALKTHSISAVDQQALMKLLRKE